MPSFLDSPLATYIILLMIVGLTTGYLLSKSMELYAIGHHSKVTTAFLITVIVVQTVLVTTLGLIFLGVVKGVFYGS